MSHPPAPSLADAEAAARRLASGARRTPLEFSAALSEAAGVEVHLKLENLQRTGSFKLRGALNAVGLLATAERARGLVTASAGNHGLGVALAARLHGAQATVFVPAAGSETKRLRIARYGAALREVPGGYDDAHAAAEAFAEQTGALYVHAFSDPAVVAGQATVALEILEELPGVGTLLVPVGGGGLIGGTGVVARALQPQARVVGVQSEVTAAMHDSLATGRPVPWPERPTLCDGLAGDIDAASLALAQQVVDEVRLVGEPAIRRAIRWLYMQEGLVAEGSAAVGAAALLDGAGAELRPPVAVILSGGNLDAALLAAILSDGT